MSQESTTHDLVELTRRGLEAANRHDFGVLMSFFAPDTVWEGAGLGTTFEGLAAIRGFWEDWFASYDELGIDHPESPSCWRQRGSPDSLWGGQCLDRGRGRARHELSRPRRGPRCRRTA